MHDVPGRAFRTAFARRAVDAMADRRSFERGLLYAANGRVGKPTVAGSSGQAKVRGSTLAELTGDVDAVVEVLARDHSSAYQFVRIVEVLREARRYDDALVCAEKGWRCTAGPTPGWSGPRPGAADREADFTPYVATLGAAHKPKRNLMTLFRERSWVT